MKDLTEGIQTLIEQAFFLTLCAGFHYLLTLNEVLLQYFSFYNNRA